MHESDVDQQRSDPLLGKNFLDQYFVLEVKGTGGMSTIYKARRLRDQHMVAIKILHAHILRNSASTKRLQKEAKALQVLSHPNIVSISDLGVTPEGQPYLVMDYVDGVSLEELLREHGAVRQERAVNMFLQICSALEYAHAQGILHRDIKPSNIMICQDDDGQYKVLVVDFGLAKLSAEHTDHVSLTATGEILGSPPYMSPEQCRGEDLDARTDVYSLGCLMYETLTGVPPFRADSWTAFIYKHLNEAPPPFKDRRQKSQVSKFLESIVLTALEKQPGRRQQSVQELRLQLEKWMAHGHSSGDLLAPFLVPRQTFYQWSKVAGKSAKLIFLSLGTGLFCAALAVVALVSFDMPESAPRFIREGCWALCNRSANAFIDMQ